MADIRTIVKLDWFTGTTRAEIPVFFEDSKAIRAKGAAGYHSAIRTAFGTYYKGDEKQGNMFTMTGQNLDKIREVFGMNDLEIARSVEGLKCTRVDLAQDVYGSSLTTLYIEELYLRGLFNTRVKSATLIKDPNGIRGDTFYLGSKKNPTRLVRFYEKSKQEQDFLDRFRIELQINTDGGSKEVMEKMRNEQTAFDLEASIRETISGHIKHDSSIETELSRVLSAEWRAYKTLDKHKNNRKKWLIEQCLPALREEMGNEDEFRQYVIDFLFSREGV